MNGILSMAQLLAHSDSLSTENAQNVETILSSGTTLLNLLNDILDLSKIEAEKIELENIPISIPNIIHDAASLFTVAARKKGIDLHVEIFLEKPNENSYSGDPHHLRQILINLIGNAVKFTEKGQILVSVVICHWLANLLTMPAVRGGLAKNK